MDSATLKRSLILLGLLAALFSLVILASGIGQLEFDSALSVSPSQMPASPASPSERGDLDLYPLVTLFIVLTALILPIYIYLLWRYPQLRPRRIFHLAFALILITATVVLSPNARQVYPGDTLEDVAQPVTIDREEEIAPEREVIGVVPDTLLVNLVGLAVALAVAGLVLLVGLAWVLSRPRKPETGAEFIIPARAALDEIRAGGDSHNAILRCYYQMQEIASARHSLQRQAGVTPREFARRLEGAGLPGRDVQRLTRLFEAVRYGNKPFSPSEETEAEHCLAGVVEALEGRS